jgi:SAM-dependent methyltransferase
VEESFLFALKFVTVLKNLLIYSNNMIKKIITSYKEIGFINTLIRILTYGQRRNQRKNFNEMLKFKDIQSRFTKIYENKLWGDDGSVSGPGSVLENTQTIRKELPHIFEKLEIKTVLDAACGDFTWMQQVVRDSNIKYIGGDIVDEMIQDLNKKYADTNTSFIHLDITESKLPDADIIICRDVLFHLSFKNIIKFFENLKESNFKYIAMTNNIGNFENKDIDSGKFRRLNFFIEPFLFSETSIVHRFADNPEGMIFPRELIIYEKIILEKYISNCIKNYNRIS